MVEATLIPLLQRTEGDFLQPGVKDSAVLDDWSDDVLRNMRALKQRIAAAIQTHVADEQAAKEAEAALAPLKDAMQKADTAFANASRDANAKRQQATDAKNLAGEPGVAELKQAEANLVELEGQMATATANEAQVTEKLAGQVNGEQASVAAARAQLATAKAQVDLRQFAPLAAAVVQGEPA